MIFCDWQDGNFERQQIQRSKDREIGGGGGGVSGDNNGGCSGRVPWCRPEPGGGAPPLLVRRPRQLDRSQEVRRRQAAARPLVRPPRHSYFLVPPVGPVVSCKPSSKLKIVHFDDPNV